MGRRKTQLGYWNRHLIFLNGVSELLSNTGITGINLRSIINPAMRESEIQKS